MQVGHRVVAVALTKRQHRSCMAGVFYDSLSDWTVCFLDEVRESGALRCGLWYFSYSRIMWEEESDLFGEGTA